jgi:hypothetical protein|nr:MAG TPA: hypothetical protein [Caudoviricetes sp.]
MPEEKKRMSNGNAVRPAEKRERLHEPHDGLLPEMRLESGGAGAAQGAAAQKERGRPAAQGYQHQGIGNQPGNHILSDLCRGRSAMRRLREDHPALHPAHRKLPQALCAGDKKRVWNVRARMEPVNVTPHGGLA